MLTILRNARNAMGKDAEVTLNLLTAIEVHAMAALQGDKVIVPSKLFGDIDIPQDIITEMSNGDDDQWFSHGCALDINIFHDKEWMFAIYPIKNGDTDTGHIIETGQL
jgi:hypothetical protein